MVVVVVVVGVGVGLGCEGFLKGKPSDSGGEYHSVLADNGIESGEERAIGVCRFNPGSTHGVDPPPPPCLLSIPFFFLSTSPLMKKILLISSFFFFLNS